MKAMSPVTLTTLGAFTPIPSSLFQMSERNKKSVKLRMKVCQNLGIYEKLFKGRSNP